MGLLTFALNVTLDGCCDHREGVVDDEMLRYWTRLMDSAGAMLFGRRTYELMEDAWPSRPLPTCTHSIEEHLLASRGLWWLARSADFASAFSVRRSMFRASVGASAIIIRIASSEFSKPSRC